MENSSPNGENVKAKHLIVRLPWLCEMPEVLATSKYEMAGLCRLWPGLPDMPSGSWHRPANFPIKPEHAQKYLADLASLEVMDLAYAQNLDLAADNLKQANNLAEMAELACFEQEGKAKSSKINEDLALIQAHKTLLWIWLSQNRACEIAKLTQIFSQKADSFSAILAEGEETIPPKLDGQISIDEAIFPSWQTVFLNAMRFLDPEITIFAEGSMRLDLLERENFQPAKEYGERITTVTLPLWRVVGNRRLAQNFARDIKIITFME